MFVMSVIAQLVLGGVFVETNRTVGIVELQNMHSNRRMLEWGGFPGDTGTL